METPQALKLGATSMLLWALEHAEEADFDMRGLIEGLRLADPVGAMHTVSHDLSLNAELALEQGGTTTAWQMQVRLRAAVYAVAAIVLGTDTAGEPAWEDRQTRNIMAMWGQALADTAAIRHASAGERLAMRDEAGRIEWLLKWQLLEKMRRRLGNAAWNRSTIGGHRPELGGARSGSLHLRQGRIANRTHGHRPAARPSRIRGAADHACLAACRTREAFPCRDRGGQLVAYHRAYGGFAA